MKNKDELIKICNLIIEDTENDVKKFKGAPFDGATVGQWFGQQAAAITGLANIVKEILINK